MTLRRLCVSRMLANLNGIRFAGEKRNGVSVKLTGFQKLGKIQTVAPT